MCPGCCGRNSSQINTACPASPDLRNSLASGAKYRRGFSSNFFFSSSKRAEPDINASVAAQPSGERSGIRYGTRGTCQSEVPPSLDFSPRRRLAFSTSPLPVFPQLQESCLVLQTMRSSAKVVMWILLISFVGGFLLVESSGLLGRTPVTPTTAVASVNGTDI